MNGFIQRERDKFIYYIREYNDKGEQVSQMCVSMKPELMSEHIKSVMEEMEDGDRIKYT